MRRHLAWLVLFIFLGSPFGCASFERERAGDPLHRHLLESPPHGSSAEIHLPTFPH